MKKEEFLKKLELLLQDISEEERKDALAFYRSYFEDAGEGNEENILRELVSPEKVAEDIKKNLNVGEADSMEYTAKESYDAETQAAGDTGSYGNTFYGNTAYGNTAYGNTTYTEGSGEHGFYGNTAYGQQEPVKPQKKNNSKNTVLWVVLAVVTSPAWLTALLVLAAILVAILACIFGLAAADVAVMAALLICGFILSGVGIGYMVTNGVAVGMGLFGGGLLVLAAGALAIWLVVWCFGWFVPWAVKKLVKLCKKPFEKRKEGAAA